MIFVLLGFCPEYDLRFKISQIRRFTNLTMRKRREILMVPVEVEFFHPCLHCIRYRNTLSTAPLPLATFLVAL